jgi:hypothetical protein
MAREIITLSNGKRVANFSSPHSFTFTDGSEIPAVDAEESVRLKVTFNEDIDEDGDVRLDFTLSDAVIEEMKYWMKLWINKEVDVVFCCLPMITAINDAALEHAHDTDRWYNDVQWAEETCNSYKDTPPPEIPKVLQPFVVKGLTEDVYHLTNLKSSPFRAVRMEDRIEKLLSIDKQCL